MDNSHINLARIGYMISIYLCFFFPVNSSGNDTLPLISPDVVVNFAVVDQTLLLSINIPVKSTVGFDLPAKNDKQRSALSRTTMLLENSKSVVLIPESASCNLITSEMLIRNLVLTGNLIKLFEIGWFYHCEDIDEITEIEISLFRYFPKILKILLVVPPDRQYLVSAAAPKVNF
ncbi:MAG: hypothetical protein CL398_04960 [Acidiferrobacteraceae bacterium]|nr:hypothetical protein [Acidiferrobacteraceae bacterium]